MLIKDIAIGLYRPYFVSNFPAILWKYFLQDTLTKMCLNNFMIGDSLFTHGLFPCAHNHTFILYMQLSLNIWKFPAVDHIFRWVPVCPEIFLKACNHLLERYPTGLEDKPAHPDYIHHTKPNQRYSLLVIISDAPWRTDSSCPSTSIFIKSTWSISCSTNSHPPSNLNIFCLNNFVTFYSLSCKVEFIPDASSKILRVNFPLPDPNQSYSNVLSQIPFLQFIVSLYQGSNRWIFIWGEILRTDWDHFHLCQHQILPPRLIQEEWFEAASFTVALKIRALSPLKRST